VTASILIVEDEPLLARNMARYLERQGHEIATAATCAQGLAAGEHTSPDIVLVDHNLPDGTGIDLIRALRCAGATAKVVMITAHGSIALAVEAMKAGADDYLTKPVSLEELGLLVERLVSRRQTEDTLAYYRRRDESRGGLDRILGASPAMVALRARIGQILEMQARQTAGAPPPVLITGETGTGKELVARALHFDGSRRGGPFVEINCGALPGQLVESELFGHERGAFTDARERRVGLIQSADGGTLFLDEIGDMPLPAQVKLLKVLEEGRVRPVGSSRERVVDIRIVAATNAAIEDRAHSGEFRADLYYRLRGVTIEVPPLRERGEDVLLLARRFLADSRRRYGRAELELGDAASAALLSHTWPGNVRELRQVIEQAVLLAVGERIGPADLNMREPPRLGLPARTGEAPLEVPGATLGQTERELIAQALRRAGGNVTVAAAELGISRDTLRYRMERHGLRRSTFT